MGACLFLLSTACMLSVQSTGLLASKPLPSCPFISFNSFQQMCCEGPDFRLGYFVKQSRCSIRIGLNSILR